MAIRASGLVRRYGAVEALAGVDLEVPSGAFFALVGPNGAGKSTTVRILAGVISRSAGDASVLGMDPDRHADRLKRCVGVVPDFPALYDELSPRQGLLRIASIRGISQSEATQRLDELARALGLSGQLDQPVSALSHGTRKKATLAAALLHAPRLLFLDEPFEGIDPISAHAIRALLDELRRRGVTVFLTSHVLPIVEAVATHVAILAEGLIVQAGTLEAVRAQHATLEGALIDQLGEQDALPALDWYRP